MDERERERVEGDKGALDKAIRQTLICARVALLPCKVTFYSLPGHADDLLSRRV